MEGWLLKNRSFLVSPLPHLPTHAASIGLMLPNVSNPKLRTHRSRRPQPPHHHHQWPRCCTRCLRAHEADLSRRVKSLGSSGCYEGRSCPQYSIPDGAAILRRSTTNLPECSSAFQIPNLLISEIEFKFLIVSGMFLVSIWKVLGIFHDLPMLFPLRFVYCPLCSMIFQCFSMFFLSFSLQFPIMSHHLPMILPFVPPFWSATPRDFFPCLQGRGPVARWRLAGQPHQSRVLGRSRGAGERGGEPGASWRWIWRFPSMGVPQNGWFRLENLVEIDDLGGPLF